MKTEIKRLYRKDSKLAKQVAKVLGCESPKVSLIPVGFSMRRS